MKAKRAAVTRRVHVRNEALISAFIACAKRQHEQLTDGRLALYAAVLEMVRFCYVDARRKAF